MENLTFFFFPPITSILHRDLKTANIFLTKDSDVKLGDFGIAKLVSATKKQASTVIGTPYYISPELCQGKPYDQKSDIWALGCILYEMVSRKKTFDGSNLPALVNKIMTGSFAPITGTYSQELKELIRSLLSKDPRLRPTTSDLLDHALLREAPASSQTGEEGDMSDVSSITELPVHESTVFVWDSGSLTPSRFNFPSSVKIMKVAVGNGHCIMLSSDRFLLGWGQNTFGQVSGFFVFG